MGVLARELPLPGGSTLALKVAVAVGEARRFVVGDPAAQRIDVLAGPLVDRLAVAEGMAERGEVIADDTVVASLGDRLVVDAVAGRRHHGPPPRARRAARRRHRRRWPPCPTRALPVEVVREWIAPDVFDRLVSGGDLFLAELRAAYPIFVRFGGFDFEHGDVEGVLDEFIREVQATLARFGGFLLGITVGDKGAYLNAVVGTPRSHEDDAHRAVAASVAIRDLEGRTAASSIQVGVSVGQVYSGTYGSPTRRAMSVLGDPVNLAARLMTAAPSGGVYVFGDVADAVEEHFEWLDLPPLALKGKTEPVRARSVVRERARRPQRVRRYPLPMVGRDRELDLVRTAIGDAVAGDRRVITVAADAGPRQVALRRRGAPARTGRRHPGRVRPGRVDGALDELLPVAHLVAGPARRRRRVVGDRGGRAPRTRAGGDRPCARAATPTARCGRRHRHRRRTTWCARSTPSCASRRSRTCSATCSFTGSPAARTSSSSTTCTGPTRCRSSCCRRSCGARPGRGVAFLLAHRPGGRRDAPRTDRDPRRSCRDRVERARRRRHASRRRGELPPGVRPRRADRRRAGDARARSCAGQPVLRRGADPVRRAIRRRSRRSGRRRRSCTCPTA